MNIGDRAEHSHGFSEAQIQEFVSLGGPVVGAGEVPEVLIWALFSRILGTRLPGIGTNYLKQSARFIAPALIGQRLTAEVRVTRIRPDKHLVDLETTCRSESGQLLCQGRALVYVGDVEGVGPAGRD